jgi:hypothetical protein
MAVKKFLVIRKCTWNGKFWDPDGAPKDRIYIGPTAPLWPNGKPVPHFKEMAETPSEKVELAATSMSEAMLMAMSGDKIRAYIDRHYGITIEKGDLSHIQQQALEVLKNPDAKRKALSELVPDPNAKAKVDKPNTLKKVSDMSPDELANTGKKELADRLGVSHTSFNKETLIQMCLDQEAKG